MNPTRLIWMLRVAFLLNAGAIGTDLFLFERGGGDGIILVLMLVNVACMYVVLRALGFWTAYREWQKRNA